MQFRHVLTVAFLASALVLPGGAREQYAQSQKGNAAEAQAVVKVAKSDKYGQYLTDAQGRALYLFMADENKQGSTCYDACATAWPPYITKGAPKTGDPAVQQDLLGTTKRKDGALQVTYGGWPLYYYIRDKGAGDVTGQDVKGFGAEWYLIRPSGKKVEGH